MKKESVITSKQFTLGGRDFWRGLLVAVMASAIMVIETSLAAGVLIFDWKKVGMAAIAGGLAYLTKNFFAKPEVSKEVTNARVDDLKENGGEVFISVPKPPAV